MGWSGNANGNTNPLTVTMTDNKTISATFSRTKYVLSVNVIGQGNVSQEVIREAKTEDEYNSGTLVRLNATPESGWLFYNWSGASTATTDQIDLTLNESKPVTATFEEQYTNVKDEANSFRGVGKWKIRKRGESAIKVSLTECAISEIIFRTDGTFTLITSTSSATFSGEYEVETNTSISLTVNDAPFGTITNLVLTDSFTRFSIEINSLCSQDLTGDRDFTYNEAYDPYVSEGARVITRFENDENTNLVGFNGCSFYIGSNPDTTGLNTSANSGEIINYGADFEGVIIAPKFRIDMTNPAQQIIKLDFYQPTASEILLVTKLESAIYTAFNDSSEPPVEVAQRVNQQGWQTVSFDFANDRVNSPPFDSDPLAELSNYSFISFFVGLSSQISGTFYIDNVRGGLEGGVIPDTDGDNIFDSIDNCINEPGIILNYGCPQEDNNGEVNSGIFIDADGITIRCPNAEVGFSQEINGKTYEVVDESTLRNKVANDEDVTCVCTSRVTDMNHLFQEKREFNQDISSWDTSNVYSMEGLFVYAISFNQAIGNWDVSNVTTMDAILLEASSFNQDIGRWNTSQVQIMRGMFAGANAFNQDIGDWDTSNVTTMEVMFSRDPATNPSAFNQDISQWDTSNVTSMGGMFLNASAFNQNLSNWEVNNVGECTDFSLNASNWSLDKPNFSNCTP